MILIANTDSFGHPEQLTSRELRHILDLIDGYVQSDYRIISIERDDVRNPLGRIDIQIERRDGEGILFWQKLLILKDELIDGKTFHARFEEFYPRDKEKSNGNKNTDK